MRSPVLFLLLALLSTAAAAQTAAPVSSYRDEALHFESHYPAEFLLTPEVATAMANDTRARVPDAAKEWTRCVTTPFAAEHKGTLASVEALFIIRADLVCLKKDPALASSVEYLSAIATSTLREGLIKFPSAIITDPVTYTRATHAAVYVQGGGSNGPARSGYSGVACIAFQANVVCWAAFTPLRSRLGTLLTSTTVAIGGEPHAPVVPPDLAATPPAW